MLLFFGDDLLLNTYLFDFLLLSLSVLFSDKSLSYLPVFNLIPKSILVLYITTVLLTGDDLYYD